MRGARTTWACTCIAILSLTLLACSKVPVPRLPALGSPERPVPSLHVMVTNDDGVNAPGLAELRQSLLAEGHRVTVVAPSVNRSGSSVSLTTDGVLTVRELQPGIYSVDGTPADCALLGLRHLMKEPVDIVVSGVNFGQNIGARTVSSGTVGAAITAAGEGVPAIASSQTVDPVDYRNTPRFLPDSAAFTAHVVSTLAAQGEEPLLPRGVVLNINYPARERSEVAGVMLTHQGASILYELRYSAKGQGRYEVSFARAPKVDADKHADTQAIDQGYVSLTPLQGSWMAEEEHVLLDLKRVAEQLVPPAAEQLVPPAADSASATGP